MQNDVEKYGIVIVIVFGALTIGGLMGAAVGFGNRDGFLFSLGAATAVWVAGYAMVFNLPRVFGVLIVVAILMAAAATVVLLG